jgi:hypothetical protein
MRWSSLLVLALVTACAHQPVDPEQVAVRVEPDLTDCLTERNEVPLRVEVHNRSAGKLRLGANGKSGPPFSLNWVYYRVMSGTPGAMSLDLAHGPGGHGRLSTSTVTIGPGDSTQFLVPLYTVGPGDYAASFQIEIQDLTGTSYMSQPFSLCSPGSMPNNSFKPKPLRGSA